MAFVVLLDFKRKLLSFGAFKQETDLYSRALACNVCTDRVWEASVTFMMQIRSQMCALHTHLCVI